MDSFSKEKPSLTRAASLLALALAVVLALGLALLRGAFRRAFLGLALLIVALFAFLKFALLALAFRRICRFSRTLPLSFARRRVEGFAWLFFLSSWLYFLSGLGVLAACWLYLPWSMPLAKEKKRNPKSTNIRKCRSRKKIIKNI